MTRTFTLTNCRIQPSEKRKDIWWFERNGSNIIEAVENISLCFTDEGKQRFERYNDLQLTFAEIESERDCYVKYYRAKYFAKHLGLNEKYRMYTELADQELARINANGNSA